MMVASGLLDCRLNILSQVLEQALALALAYRGLTCFAGAVTV